MNFEVPGLFSKGGVGVLRGVVRAAFTQTVSLFVVAHTKLTVCLCLAKLTPPNTPDTPCLQVIRASRVDVPFIDDLPKSSLLG